MYKYRNTASIHYFANIRDEFNKANGGKGSLNSLVEWVKLDATEWLKRFGLTRYLEVIERAGMVDELNAAASLAMYAPTNEAFENLSNEDTERMLSTPEACRELVRIHSIYGSYRVPGIVNSTGQEEFQSWQPKVALIRDETADGKPIVISSQRPNACAVQLFYVGLT